MLFDDLKTRVFTYQKEGDALRLSVLRYLLSSLQNKEIELRVTGDTITDEIVKKTIERYGGEVSFENNVPKGTTFILKLKKSL